MGDYSQKELLLLSNFVYIPACAGDDAIEDIIGRYRDESGGFTDESVAAAAAGGGMSVSDVCTVFQKMDEQIKEDPDFGRLSAARRLDEKDVRAICYTNEEDANPVVVFRGTGGTKEAWVDNFEGAYADDTRIQKVADDFVRYECGIYEDIVVTGHSKGGNMAQYVTVKREDMIESCVSFDGQGFGNVFIEDNTALVPKASPKITSICAYNDFVNILLTSIAGTCIFVDNEEGAAAAHSSVTLLTRNTFDEEGNFTSIRSQGLVSKELGRLTDIITAGLDPAKEEDKEELSLIAGSAISLALTTPEGSFLESCVAPVTGMIAAGFVKKITQTVRNMSELSVPAAQSLYIDTGSAAGVAKDISSLTQELRRISIGVDGVRQNMAFTINTQIVAENLLEGVVEDIAGVSRRICDLSETVLGVVRCYEAAESEAAALMNA